MMYKKLKLFDFATLAKQQGYTLFYINFELVLIKQ